MKNSVLSALGKQLVNGSLSDPLLLAKTKQKDILRILPDANVIKLGGQSLIDRRRDAVLPVIEEIVQNLPQHQIIIDMGAGT